MKNVVLVTRITQNVTHVTPTFMDTPNVFANHVWLESNVRDVLLVTKITQIVTLVTPIFMDTQIVSLVVAMTKEAKV